jgi:hypothetical protein
MILLSMEVQITPGVKRFEFLFKVLSFVSIHWVVVKPLQIGDTRASSGTV